MRKTKGIYCSKLQIIIGTQRKMTKSFLSYENKYAFWRWLRSVHDEYNRCHLSLNLSFVDYVKDKYGISPLLDSSSHGFSGEYKVINEEKFFLEKLKGLSI